MKGSAGVPSRCRAVFCAADEEGNPRRTGVARLLCDGASCLDASATGSGFAFELLLIAAKQARKSVMARIGQRDKVVSECLSLLIGVRGNSKILYVSGSISAIGAHRQAALYYLYLREFHLCLLLRSKYLAMENPTL